MDAFLSIGWLPMNLQILWRMVSDLPASPYEYKSSRARLVRLYMLVGMTSEQIERELANERGETHGS